MVDLANLNEAEKSIRMADHMIYVTYPLIKDKRLILKIIKETSSAISICISLIMEKEEVSKKILSERDPRINFQIFKERFSQKDGFTKEELVPAAEIFEFLDERKKSQFEFGKDGKLVILSDESFPRIMTIEKTKEFMAAAKNILRKTKVLLTKN